MLETFSLGAAACDFLLEGLWLEKGLNQRWGEDDDPQLKMWNDWKDRLNNNPI